MMLRRRPVDPVFDAGRYHEANNAGAIRSDHDVVNAATSTHNGVQAQYHKHESTRQDQTAVGAVQQVEEVEIVVVEHWREAK
jgi:hypothetical protein